MRIVVNRAGQPLSRDEASGTLLLMEDTWNDWYQWKTLYVAYFVGAGGELTELGPVKIADLNTKYVRNESTGGTRAVLPKVITSPIKTLVSLGQDEFYYLKLRKCAGEPAMREFLVALGDIALSPPKPDEYTHNPILHDSLCRGLSKNRRKLFERIATGRGKANFKFNYSGGMHENSLEDQVEIDFSVVADSTPPTNVHVLIGRNGAGKTTLMQKMAMAKLFPDNGNYGQYSSPNTASEPIENIVYVSFSAFDKIMLPVSSGTAEGGLRYSFVGLQYQEANTQPRTGVRDGKTLEERDLDFNDCSGERSTRTVDELSSLFAKAALSVMKKGLATLWASALKSLESDINFRDYEISELANYELSEIANDTFLADAQDRYEELSSGHKIVLLCVTKLVETVTERTLVLLDEPEGHLHPPLISAFTRALSGLMRERNGLAVIATHSPVILQEVPKSCVTRITRDGNVQRAHRLERETFGENVGALTSAVFGLEVTQSGFHALLMQALDELHEFDPVVEHFGGNLGFEARAILMAEIVNREAE